MISGFKIFAGMYVAMIAAPPEATNISGNIFPTVFKSTLPERKNFNALVNVLKELANLFVPKATDGGKPTASNAGVEISPPPPTTESTNEAIKPKATIINIIDKFQSILSLTPLFLLHYEF